MTRGWQTIGRNGALVINECGNPKAGKYSVGVFTAYVKDDQRLLLNHRLYLPADWINDPARCDAAGIPKENQVFKTKAELAYDMIGEAQKIGT